MAGFLSKLLVALGGAAAATTSPAVAEPMSARDTVLRFAETFLDADAVARLSDPVATDYETFMDVAPGETVFSDGLWGQVLLEEMLEQSAKAVWLDWKYNVLTLIQDDDWDDQLGKVFAQNGVAAPTDAEREAILSLAAERHGDRPQVMMFPELQPLAEKRGYRLMILDNDSDGLALFMLPLDTAPEWHMTHLGHVLIVDAAVGQVADPRRNGKMSVLTN